MLYTEIINNTIAHWREAELLDQSALERSFAIFCSNVMRFHKNTELSILPDLYRKLMVRIALTQRDQSLRVPESCFEITGSEAIDWELFKARPGIIATFHTGSYRLLGRLLGRHKVPLALLVSASVYHAQKAGLHKDFYADDPRQSTSFEVINAEAPGALHRMMGQVKAGRNLLIYLDGNTGQQQKVRAFSAVPVEFLDSFLQVRAGAAGLSYLTGAPIYPVLCTRPEWTRVDLQLQECFQPHTGENKAGYMRRALQGAYQGLSRVLRRDLSEWEGWLYLLPAGGRVPVNSADEKAGIKSPGNTPEKAGSRFFPFRLNGKFYAMESPALRTYAIGKPQYQDIRRALKTHWNL